MKTRLIILITLLISLSSIAQQGINYKALIKDSAGNTVANQSITIQFTILQGSTNVYTETHVPTTDANGIVIINIGKGAIQSGDFATIDWAIDDYFLNVQIDTGNGLVDIGTTQFMTVPYAKHAQTATTANNVTGLEAIDEGNGIGWRLKGKDPNLFGNIGNNATDLSYSFFDSTSGGATGEYSTTIGLGTKAESQTSMAIGAYNIGGGSDREWVDTDPLFEIGNGTSSSNNNALTVYKNGDVKFDGEVQHTRSGQANMIPIAYGHVGNDTISLLTSSGNITIEVELTTDTSIPIPVLRVEGINLEESNSVILISGSPQFSLNYTTDNPGLEDGGIFLAGMGGPGFIGNYHFIIYQP